MSSRFQRHRSSSPVSDHNVEMFTINESLDYSDTDLMMQTGDSTRSLLAPVYNNDTFQSEPFKELPSYNKDDRVEKDHGKNSSDESLLSVSISNVCSDRCSCKSPVSNAPNTVSPNSTMPSHGESKCSQHNESKECIDASNISWEQWLLKKTIDDIENFNLKRTKRRERARDKKKFEEEKSTRLQKDAQQREEWVKKKDMERQNKLREKEAEIRSQKLKAEEEKRLIKERSITKFQEWQEDKLKKQKEEQKKLFEEKQKANTQSKQKKLSSEESYRSWLEKSKTKKVNRSTYGYANGSLMSYYDMGCSPAPSYKNPLPWVDIVQPSDKGTSKQQSFFSPPLLWEDVEKRDNAIKKKRKKKPQIVKHSCIGNN